MLVLCAPAKNETVVRNSRFIAEAVPVNSAEEAREVLRQRKEEYADASHVVHAFVVGIGASIMGCSDDGEPPGTSGRPALEVLKGSGITNIIVTITRYFGGSKLGTGGLVKAYTESVQQVLELAQTKEWVATREFSLQAPYTIYEPSKKILLAHDAEISDEHFADEVTLRGSIREDASAQAAQELQDLSRGQSSLQFKEEEGEEEDEEGEA
jgi:uncharacterized YigZ family protein